MTWTPPSSPAADVSKPAATDAATNSGARGGHDPQQRGTLDVRTVAIGHIAEHVASQVPGTVAHSTGLGKLLGKKYPSVDVDVRGSSTWIRLEIAVVWPTAVENIAARARDKVRSETARLSGSDVRRVDVTVHVLAPDQVDDTGRRVA